MIGALVKIAVPHHTRRGSLNLCIAIQYLKRHRTFHAPCQRLGVLIRDRPCQRTGDLYPLTIIPFQRSAVLPRRTLVPEQKCTDTIHLEIKIIIRPSCSRCKKKLYTAVLPDRPVSCCRNRPNIPVCSLKNHIQKRIIITHFRLSGRTMLPCRRLSKGNQQWLDILPCGLIVIRIDNNRLPDLANAIGQPNRLQPARICFY